MTQSQLSRPLSGKYKLYRANWGFLEVEYELGRYLRKLFWLHTNGVYKLGRPSNDEHITIFTPREYEASKHVSGEYEFQLDFSNVWTNSNAFWLDVVSPQIESLRTSLGLGPQEVPIHFCFGYLYAGKAPLDVYPTPRT